MRRFFDSRVSFFAVLFLFAAGFAWNVVHGSDATASGHRQMAPSFPWNARIAHGPTVPPDPWNARIAHGPTVPPDPWNARIAG